MRRELPTREIIDVPQEEVDAILALEAEDSERERVRLINKIGRLRILEHIGNGSDDDLAETLTKTLVVLAGLGRLLISKGVITPQEAVDIMFAGQLNTRAQDVESAIAAIGDAVSNGDSVTVFNNTLDTIFGG